MDFYDIEFTLEYLSNQDKDDIEYLINKIDIYYDMCDWHEDKIRHGTINRKIVNQIITLGFKSCKYKLFKTNEMLINHEYCKEYDDYATGKISIKGIPNIYPINKELDDWTPDC